MEEIARNWDAFCIDPSPLYSAILEETASRVTSPSPPAILFADRTIMYLPLMRASVITIYIRRGYVARSAPGCSVSCSTRRRRALSVPYTCRAKPGRSLLSFELRSISTVCTTHPNVHRVLQADPFWNLCRLSYPVLLGVSVPAQFSLVRICEKQFCQAMHPTRWWSGSRGWSM